MKWGAHHLPGSVLKWVFIGRRIFPASAEGAAIGGWGWGWAGLGWVWGGGLVLVGAGSTAAPCPELEGPLLRLSEGSSLKDGASSWIFSLMALSTGHRELPHTSSPRTGSRRRGRAFILQLLKEGTHSWVSPFSSGEGQASRAGGIWNPGSLWGTRLESHLCWASGLSRSRVHLPSGWTQQAESRALISCLCCISLFKASGHGASCLGWMFCPPWPSHPTSGAKRKPPGQTLGAQG